MTRPFNPPSTNPAAATNKSAVARAHTRGIQAILARELDSYRIRYRMDTVGT